MVVLSRPARGPELIRLPILALALGLTGTSYVGLVTAASSPQWGAATRLEIPAAATSSTGLGVFIGGPGSVVDPGVPVTLHANVAGGLPPLEYLWTSPTLGSWTAANWTIELASGLNATIRLEVADASGAWGTANLTVGTSAPLRLALSVPASEIDVGSVVPAAVGIEGGVPPFQLGWTFLDAHGSGSEIVASDGSLTLPIPANDSNATWIRFTVTDSVGGAATDEEPFPRAFGLPAVSGNLAPDVGEVGRPVALSSMVTGGAPPLHWTITPLGSVANGSTRDGSLNGSGSIEWTAIPTTSGNLSIEVDVVDAAGAVARQVYEIPVLSAIRADLGIASIAGSSGSPIAVVGTMWGGQPPYSYSILASDGERSAGVLAGPGAVNLTLVPAGSGLLGVTLSFRDSLGFETESSLIVRIATSGGTSSGGEASSNGDGSILSIALAAILASAASFAMAVLWQRRYRGRPAGPDVAASPFEVLRRLLSAHDDIDRSSLEFLAEEQGIPPERVDALLEEAIRTGRVRVHEDSDGDRLSWVGNSPGESGAGSTRSPSRPEGG